MKIFSKVSDDVLSHIERMQSEYHPDLQDVTVDAVFVFDDEASSESVLKHQGYAAAAVIRITPVRDRTLGVADAVITIDRATWVSLSALQRDALVDHELQHLEWLKDNEGKPKSDGLGRPKLGMVRHDHQIGYFTDVVQRHGEAALEIRAARYLIAEIGQMKFEFGSSEPNVTMTHSGETVDITATLARIREESEPALTL
jgi:hypothetical protein